uniref:Uncharacterized protein n=1 Tax=Anguilla anguilla TaxID=7936 RepID=A0A0E9XKY7_ANGAN
MTQICSVYLTVTRFSMWRRGTRLPAVYLYFLFLVLWRGLCTCQASLSAVSRSIESVFKSGVSDRRAATSAASGCGLSVSGHLRLSEQRVRFY